jgi:hypothetical protein
MFRISHRGEVIDDPDTIAWELATLCRRGILA